MFWKTFILLRTSEGAYLVVTVNWPGCHTPRSLAPSPTQDLRQPPLPLSLLHAELSGRRKRT